MLGQSVRLTGMLATGALMMETIASRFGEITVDTSKSLLFARGLLGMPEGMNFALATFPNPKMSQFMLLQSLDRHSLSFITLPLEITNAIIGADDVRAACRDLQIVEADLVMLLVVSVHRGLGDVKLSVNARAPLMIDVNRRTGAQYVFQHDAYKVQHML